MGASPVTEGYFATLARQLTPQARQEDHNSTIGCGMISPAAFLMPVMRFVRFADVHIDSSIGGAIDLPADKRSTLRQDLRTALSRACEQAVEHRADLVLIPGDLFDHEAILPDAPAFLAEVLGALAPVRVFITPGNHDSLRPGSPYLPRLGVKWPGNVHVFTSSGFETIGSR